jgi:uncharacterized protein YoxC
MDERAHPSPAGEAIALRGSQRRRRRWQFVGIALIAYGVVGIVVLGAIGSVIGRPLDQAAELSVAIEEQRRAALDSLDQATTTIDQTAVGVRGMEPSLSQAKAATDRASALSLGLSANMFELSRAMGITVFGVQPLIGLATGFDQTGQQLQLLSADVAAIGAALDANRDDVATVAASLDELSDSVEELETSLREGPRLAVSPGTLDGIRLAILALLGWMLVLALGAVVAGAYVVWLARR